jgi:hypothetical protein
MSEDSMGTPLLREEGGFSLAEMLVAMTMMITVLFALYSIFDMTVRVFSYGNDKVEAVENARVALERMEREIRMAYPRDRAASNEALFNVSGGSFGADYASGFRTDGTRLTFGNNLNSDRTVQVYDEVVLYWVDNGKLMRFFKANPSAVLTDLGPSGSVGFQYFKDDGIDAGSEPDAVSLPLTSASELTVDVVRITLKVDVDDRIQELSTDVALRNRN